MDLPHEISARPRFPIWLTHCLQANARLAGRILERVQSGLRLRFSHLAAWWQRQPWPTRLYSGGGIVMIASIACMLIGITYRELPQILFIEGTLLLAAGIVHEGYQVGRWVMATFVGKLVATLLATMISALAMGISSVIVNDTTGFSPADFPFTMGFLAPFTAGYIAFFSILSVLLAALVAIVGLGLFAICKGLCVGGTQVEEGSAKMFARLMAAITLLALTVHVWNEQQTSYESILTSTASWFAYNFEMYGKDPCARGKHERVRRIDLGQALIGSERDGQRSFFMRRCAPSLFP